ncbi:MAG: transposase [Planctomycetia bacterium]
MVAAVTGFPARSRRRPHGGPAASRRYERRRPEKTPLHRVISENLESWLEWREAAERPVPGYVEEELRGYLGPRAVAALTKIFLDEVERLLLPALGGTPDADMPRAAHPRLGGISFLHRFGSALNHHVHLHACFTDGVFMPAADDAGCDAPSAFLPARPITHVQLAALTERVRRRVIRWFRLTRLLDAAAAADMLAWENSGFSIDASVRITLVDRDVPSYFQSLEHLLRYCARPHPKLHAAGSQWRCRALAV